MPIKEITSDAEIPVQGTLIFQQNQIPPLNAGTGAITVHQTVWSDKDEVKKTTYEQLNKFAVNGPRFSLPVGAISSVYPPENAQGDYERVIPHVCLSRATLPWERSASTSTTQLTEAHDQAPWMGLLSFFDYETGITVSNIKLKQLVKTTGGSAEDILPEHYFHPGFKLDVLSEKDTDECLVVDIPLYLFNKVAPCSADLPWMAHVREIQPSNNQSAQYLNRLKNISDERTLPKISTIIGNRLPQPGAKTTVYFVSFENWSLYLPDENGNQSANIPKGITTVRMVLLKQWDFYAIDRKQTFSQYLLNLNINNDGFGEALLKLPHTEDTDEANKAINNAFKMGFVPLDHHTRQNQHTVSWYRGPFVPYASPKGEINLPVNGPDSCTNYNPDTGMFDVSHAAAWQLGQLLALQNSHFAQTLYNWKRTNTQTVIANFEEEIIKKTLKKIVDDEPIPAALNEPADEVSAWQQEDLFHAMNKSLSTILSQFISNPHNSGDENK